LSLPGPVFTRTRGAPIVPFSNGKIAIVPRQAKKVQLQAPSSSTLSMTAIDFPSGDHSGRIGS
jgi:hypothetical protein